MGHVIERKFFFFFLCVLFITFSYSTHTLYLFLHRYQWKKFPKLPSTGHFWEKTTAEGIWLGTYLLFWSCLNFLGFGFPDWVLLTRLEISRNGFQKMFISEIQKLLSFPSKSMKQSKEIKNFHFKDLIFWFEKSEIWFHLTCCYINREKESDWGDAKPIPNLRCSSILIESILIALL